MKPFDPVVDFIIGIDPSMVVSGYAHSGPADYNVEVIGHVKGIENLRHENPLGYLATCLTIAGKGSRLFVLTEYPKWTGHGAEQVRAAANSWLRYIAALTPKNRVIIGKTVPSSWCSKCLDMPPRKGGGMEDPKPYYRAKAAELTGRADLTDDEAAAVCLLDYAKKTPSLFEKAVPTKRPSTKVSASE